MTIESQVYRVGALSSQEKTEIETNLSNYFQASLKLHNLKNKLAELETEKEKLQDGIKNILAESVFKTRAKTVSDFVGEKINHITINLKQKYLTISEVGMEEVIIPFAKKYSINEVDLSCFKDQMLGKSLEIFLKAIPETQITTVTISNAKLKVLTPEEKKQFVYLKNQKGIRLIASS